MRILITGQSGLSIKDGISIFIKNYFGYKQDNKPTPALFKVEDEISRIYSEETKTNHLPSNKVWQNFLREPYISQEKYWLMAFNKILEDVNKNEKSNPQQSIFLTLHACYYHNRTQEYLSHLLVDKLKEFGPNKIVTLIDDIYDIRHRLSRHSDDVFYIKTKGQSPNSQSMKVILQLLRTLDWRAKEIMFSRFIGKQCGDVKNYVLAIKHPWDTFYNLTEKDLSTLYFSHPISEPRRLQAAGNSESADKIIQEITDVSLKLTEKFVTFLPTTIDEFRIKRKSGSKTDFIPILTERWNKEKYSKASESLFQVSGFNDVDDLWIPLSSETNGLQSSKDNNKGEFSFILRVLSDTISDQVTTRDYTLVEQSNILVVYRPLFNGNASGGVEEENVYHDDLIRANTYLLGKKPSGKLKFIYCPLEDIEKYKKNVFNNLVLEYLKFRTFVSDSSFVGIKEEFSKKLSNAKNEELIILPILQEVLNSHQIFINDEEDTLNVKSPLKDIQKEEIKIEENFVRKYLSRIEIIDYYKSIANVFIDRNNMDGKLLVSLIESYLTTEKN